MDRRGHALEAFCIRWSVEITGDGLESCDSTIAMVVDPVFAGSLHFNQSSEVRGCDSSLVRGEFDDQYPNI